MAKVVEMPVTRDSFIAENTEVFGMTMVNTFQGVAGLRLLANFANDAEHTAHLLSQDVTQEVKGDENRLTEHADHMRRLSAHIIMLRDGLVPALKICESPMMRTQAIWTMSYIRSHFLAMQAGIF